MNNKMIAGLVIASFLLVGVVSADLLPWFGQISGSATVEAPTFYLDNSHVPFSSKTDSLAYRDLTINEVPDKEEVKYLFNGNRLIYTSEPLGVDSFYRTKFNIKLRANTSEEGNLLQLRIIKLDNNLLEDTICEPDEPINITRDHADFWMREISCSTNGTIDLDPTDRIGLEIRGTGGDPEYWIKSGGKYEATGSSRVEVEFIE